MSQYTPGTYFKGDSIKVARTAKEAVALAFQGYKLVAPVAFSAEPVVVEVEAQADPELVDVETPTPVAPRPVAPKTKKDNA